MTESVLLTQAWRRALASVGMDLTGAVLVMGASATEMAAAAGAPVRQEVGVLATLGAGELPELSAEATATATGLADGSFDSVVAMAAWDGAAEVTAVAAEAARVVRRGCDVWLGDLDAEALVTATPTVYAEAVLYRARPDAATRLLASHQPSSRLALAAMGSGLVPAVVESVQLPVAVYATPGEYLEAVRAGSWPGWDLLDDLERDDVLSELKRRHAAVDFPMVASRPWLLAHGPRRR